MKTGWLIERKGRKGVQEATMYCTLLVNPSLAAVLGSGPWFRTEAREGLRFSHESDARMFAEWALGKDHGCSICEHQWN